MKFAEGLIFLECAACLAISASQTTSSTVRSCPKLETPGNGRNSEECKGTTQVGDVCTFSCTDGYVLKGDYEHNCTEDFEWQPPHPPTCVRSCPKLETPGNGRNSDECKGTTQVGDVCTFSCTDGYVLKGDYQHNCTEDFEWQPPHPPTCVNTCPKLEELRHGKMEGKCDGTARAEDSCTFTCIRTKMIKGSRILKCKEDLEWDNPPPTCDGCSRITSHFLALTLSGIVWHL